MSCALLAEAPCCLIFITRRFFVSRISAGLFGPICLGRMSVVPLGALFQELCNKFIAVFGGRFIGRSMVSVASVESECFGGGRWLGGYCPKLAEATHCLLF